MITGAEHRANFYPDYTTRMAGAVPKYNKTDNSQAIEKLGLSAGDTTSETEEDSTFMTLLKSAIDIVNPLHHIPIVSSIYSQVTGDEINTPAKIAGGAVYGGVMGGLVSAATSVLEYMIETPPGKPVEIAKADPNSTINKAILDLEQTNSALKSYLDAEQAGLGKRTFMVSIEH